jgi:hypothetical protein
MGKKTWMLLSLLFVNVALSDAQATVASLTVPFSNVTLSAHQTLSVNYSFGPYPIIFCYANNMPSASTLIWPYKGNLYSAQLPVSLITNNRYQGQFADAAGSMTIQNNQATPLVVSCVYAF